MYVRLLPNVSSEQTLVRRLQCPPYHPDILGPAKYHRRLCHQVQVCGFTAWTRNTIPLPAPSR